MEFMYFPGDNVINQDAHFVDTGQARILIPMNVQGQVQSASADNSVITVTWDDVTLPYPVTTSVRSVSIRPFYIAPQT